MSAWCAACCVCRKSPQCCFSIIMLTFTLSTNIILQWVSDWLLAAALMLCDSSRVPPLFASEDHLNVLASYYGGLPSISFRDAVWPLIVANISGYHVHTTVECLPPDLKSHYYCEKARSTLTAAGSDLAAIDKNSLLYYGK